MADIFISYARADRARAEPLARALERTGWSVWWDREIPPGRSFDEVIEEALSTARCVIVVWSPASVRSEWVKTEASDAAQRRILVPIVADGARIPLEFRRLQAAAIDDWRDLESNDGWTQLCDAVAALVRTARPAPPVKTPARRRGVPWAVGAVGGVALLTAVAVFALRWHPAENPAAPPVGPLTAVRAATDAFPPEPPSTRLPVAPAPTRAVTHSRRAAAIVTPPPVPSSAVARAAETVADARPIPAPSVLEPTPTSGEVVRKLDREPAADAASFEVTVLYGVFRDQIGRIRVSPDGVRFQEARGGGRTFDLSCGALRRVATATMIADREQRLLELASDGSSYRVRAADTGARDSLRAAIGRACNR